MGARTTARVVRHGCISSYLERNRSRLRWLFEALGKPTDIVEGDDVALEAHLLSRWLGSEHGLSSGKEQYTPDQEAAARPILRELDVVDRIDPPSGARYDEVLVMGAAAIGIHRRLELVRESGVRAPRLTVLTGLRPHEGNPRDGTTDELLAIDGRMAAAAGWRPPAGLVARADLLQGQGVDPLTAARVLFPGESDLTELLLTKQWATAMPRTTVHAAAPHPIENELGQRDYLLRTWEVDGPILELRVLNGAPVDRGDRPPRPTSTSTLLEWLALPGSDHVERALVVVNQPHLHRVGLEVRELLRDEGHDLDVEVAGCEPSTDSSVQLLLGEVAARIALERRLFGDGA